ncbi:MAG: response regulator [Ignavibacteriae bacterium]|nr:MAG: response regulator [Ignavibacteriota bacterium]
MSALPKILVIDDEIQIRRLLQLTLEPAGYAMKFVTKGDDVIIMAGNERPDLSILDLVLPDKEGIDVLKRIREWATVPVIILSVRSSESDIISCLDAGADDYLVKPFRTGELLARVRSALRHRPKTHEQDIFTTNNLTVDLTARTVKKGKETLKLTSIEYSLLALFIRNAGRVLTHKYILEQVWGPSFAEEAQYTRVYVGQLRKKIEEDPATPKILLTESGIGYRLNVEEN